MALSIRTFAKEMCRKCIPFVQCHIPEEDRKGVVYEVPCTDCDHTYIGETGRTLRKRLTEHKAAVRRQDQNNGIAVHAWRMNHRPDWESASVKTTAKHYWKRRILETLFIQKQRPTMNLDCGLQINHTWKPTISSNIDQ